jgi:uncharacterized membrane protein YfcA
VASNVTNTVALCPGYFGGTLAQRGDLRGQRGRLRRLVPASVLGGILGGLLLLYTGERLFRQLVPYLILLAAALLAFQERLRAWIACRMGAEACGDASSAAWAGPPVTLAAVYGGYFGAGLGVITLAVLGLTLDDSITRLNALKQVVALSANVSAAAFLAFSGHVVWPAAVVMAAGALVGGAIGGRLAGRIRPGWLRWTVVVIGLAIGLIYLRG